MNLLDLGLHPGDRVRFRRRPDQRWREGTAARVERDGSLRVVDARGAARTLGVDQIEVRTTGPRGGVVWESLAERAARVEQLDLFPDAARRGR